MVILPEVLPPPGFVPRQSPIDRDHGTRRFYPPRDLYQGKAMAWRGRGSSQFYPPRDLYQGKAASRPSFAAFLFYPPRDLYQGKAPSHGSGSRGSFYPPRDLYQGKAVVVVWGITTGFYPPRDLYQGNAVEMPSTKSRVERSVCQRAWRVAHEAPTDIELGYPLGSADGKRECQVSWTIRLHSCLGRMGSVEDQVPPTEIIEAPLELVSSRT